MKSREQILKTWGSITIVSLLLLEFAVFPWLDWVSKSIDEIASARAFVSKQESVAEQYGEIENKLQQLDSQLRFFANLPELKSGQDPALLWLEVVDSAIAKTEVSVNNKSPQRPVTINDSYSAFTGRINVSGDINRVLNLLAELEQVSLGNRVRQASFHQPRARQGWVTANIEFVRVYKTK